MFDHAATGPDSAPACPGQLSCELTTTFDQQLQEWHTTVMWATSSSVSATHDYILAVSRLQTLLGGTNQELVLPGINVVGNQSVGKSSLLEGISGIRLPSAMGICTKCPLQLELHTSSSTSISISYPDPDKGMQSSPITNEMDIPKEIQRVSNLLTGGANKIVKSVITLKVASPTAPNLTLIDLPGVVGASPANYPEDTKDIINDLVTHYSTGKLMSCCAMLSHANFTRHV